MNGGRFTDARRANNQDPTATRLKKLGQLLNGLLVANDFSNRGRGIFVDPELLIHSGTSHSGTSHFWPFHLCTNDGITLFLSLLIPPRFGNGATIVALCACMENISRAKHLVKSLPCWYSNGSRTYDIHG